jgi:hypothetical protein
MASEKSARAKAIASNRSDLVFGVDLTDHLADEADHLGERIWDVEGLGLCCLPAPVGVHEQAMQGVLRVLVGHRRNLFAAVAPSSQLMAAFPSACAVLRCLDPNCGAAEQRPGRTGSPC